MQQEIVEMSIHVPVTSNSSQRVHEYSSKLLKLFNLCLVSLWLTFPVAAKLKFLHSMFL